MTRWEFWTRAADAGFPFAKVDGFAVRGPRQYHEAIRTWPTRRLNTLLRALDDLAGDGGAHARSAEADAAQGAQRDELTNDPVDDVPTGITRTTNRMQQRRRVMSTTLSLTARREMLTHQVKGLEELGQFRTVVVNGSGYSAAGLQGRIAHAGPADLDAIAIQLNAQEDEGIRSERQAREDERHDELRDFQRTPLMEDDLEFQIARQHAEEATAAAARAESPATRAQIDELISLQRDILAALAKR